MPDLPTGAAAFTRPDIVEWLVGRLAFYLEQPSSAIEPDASLVEMGLDSVYVMTLSGDVEEQFGQELPPTIAWDYDTVNKLADFLMHELGTR
jgi:acyl carrier protein